MGSINPTSLATTGEEGLLRRMLAEGGRGMTANEVRRLGYSGELARKHLERLVEQGRVIPQQRATYVTVYVPDPVIPEDAFVLPKALADIANHVTAMLSSVSWACSNPGCFYRVQPAPPVPPLVLLPSCPRCLCPLVVQYPGIS